MLSPEADTPQAEHAPACKVVVIGFGSPIRGDDAFGPLVADALADAIEIPGVEILSRHILTAELAERLRDASLVLFLDAATDGPVGEVVQHHLSPRREPTDTITHSVDARGLLAWTEGLYGCAPPALLLSTRGVNFDYANYELSPAVQAAVRPMMDRACQLIQRHLATARRA